MTGRVVHFEIPFDDAERARAFYFAAFGWELTPMEGMDYTLVITGPSGEDGPSEPGFINGGLGRRSGDLPTPTVVVDVDDIEAALGRVRELGGQAEGKQPVPGMGWFAACKDPGGTNFSLWQRDESAPMPEGAGP